MKVLWITNILFPEAISLLASDSELKASGGWMLGLADALVATQKVKLSVATVSPLVSSLTIVEGKNIVYYVIPYGKGFLKYNKSYEAFWIEIYKRCNPDIVHIHGTEYSHGLAFLNVCPNSKTVISVQGLTSVYYNYYYSGLAKFEILRNITFRDLVRCDSLFSAKRKFKERGDSVEKRMLSQVHHIIGRTSWDKAHTWAINPNAAYYFCNETLRPEFYDGSSWNYEKCLKHSIFLSQAGYPIKGLHQVIKAMPLILREYPDTKVLIAGIDITKCESFKDRIRLTGYGKIIRRMIKKYHIEKHVEFLGPMNAEEMKQAYLRCNVFVCPSTIENSPNSLGEAQILGVPCVSSYVGGVPDMMKCEEKRLYRFDDIEMLAYNVVNVFKDSSKASYSIVCDNALRRHDGKSNAEQLLTIYKTIYLK